jgi:hypothetical protein
MDREVIEQKLESLRRCLRRIETVDYINNNVYSLKS